MNARRLIPYAGAERRPPSPARPAPLPTLLDVVARLALQELVRINCEIARLERERDALIEELAKIRADDGAP